MRSALPEYAEPVFSRRYPAHIREAANEVLAEIHPIDAAVHVRRGDLVGPEVEPTRVAQHLRMQGASEDARIFIMTNETDLSFADEMRLYYPHSICEFEVPKLATLSSTKRDNYSAFRISACIRSELVTDLGSVRGPHRPPAPITNPWHKFERRIRHRRLWLEMDRVSNIWTR